MHRPSLNFIVLLSCLARTCIYKMVACTASLVATPVVAARTTLKPASKASTFKAVTVSNGTVKKTTAMQVRSYIKRR